MTPTSRFATLVTLILATTSTALSADPPMTYRGAEIVGETVVAYVFDGHVGNLPLAPVWQPGDPIKEIPRRHTHPPLLEPGPEETRPDPLLDRQREAPRGARDPGFHPMLNFPGQGFTGVNPPDTVGDVGPSHYIQSINGGSGAQLAIYDKGGAILAGPFSMESLGSGNCASGLGDPIVLYDRLANRWLMSEFSSGGNRLCVYVSRTSDPVSGGWFNYDFQAPGFPDYPKYAVWSDGYYVSSNESRPAAYALDRANMLSGAPARPAQRFTAPPLGGFGFQALTPADHDGPNAPPANSPAYFLRHRDDEVHSGNPDPAADQLELFLFKVDWNNPGNSTFTGPFQISIAEIDSSLCGLFSFSCFDQPGGGADLDPLREVVMWRLQYVNYGTHEALIGNLVTDVGGDQGGIRWFELRRSAGPWSLFQEGTYAIDSADRWMGSISQDQQGNIVVAYNVVDETVNIFPGLRYAGRLVSDPAGTLPDGEFSILEGTARNNSNRYGDYSSLNLDPANDCTFWITGEYNAAGSWSTRIATVEFEACGGPPPPAPTLTVTGGSCGGVVALSGSNFSPNTEVGIVAAGNTNGFVKGGTLCNGTSFEISEPFNLPPTFVGTDAAGSFSTTLNVPSNRCFVEALDFRSCQSSNTVDTQE